MEETTTTDDYETGYWRGYRAGWLGGRDALLDRLKDLVRYWRQDKTGIADAIAELQAVICGTAADDERRYGMPRDEA
jgi:hypothetical protein